MYAHIGFLPTRNMQTPHPHFCSHFYDRCVQCGIEWNINFPIFIFRVMADCMNNLQVTKKDFANLIQTLTSEAGALNPKACRVQGRSTGGGRSNRKIDFSFDSALCLSFTKWEQNWGSQWVVCISLVGKSPRFHGNRIKTEGEGESAYP